MKTILCIWMLTVSVALAATNTVPTTAEQEQMFVEAVMLKQQGFYAEAEIRLKKLVELQPDQPTVKQMLAEVQEKLRSKQADPATLLRRKLSEIIVPELNARDAVVSDLIELIRRESERLSKDKAPVNFVWQAPEQAKAKRVTLQLQKIPLLDVLEYVTTASGLKYRIDPHAVVIYKPEPSAPVKPVEADAKPE